MRKQLNFLVLILAATAVAAQSKPDCTSSCGDVNIPYPFGTSEGCFRDESFRINCDTGTPTVNYFTQNYSTGDLHVYYISLDGELHLSAGVASSCYNRSGWVSGNDYVYFGFPDNFTVSNTKNKFYVVGCDTNALFQDYWGYRPSTGCLSTCTEIADVTNGSCTGIGCCESSFTQEDMGYQITLLTVKNYSGVWNFNPCGYAFLAKNGDFNFSSLDLQNLRNKQDFPVVINWVIGNETCIEAKKNPTRYACRENSICADSENAPGYLCTCKNGYQGNPYLNGSNGCQATAVAAQSKPDCTSSCGDVNIPYPFGTSEGCFRDESFRINCDTGTPTVNYFTQNYSTGDLHVYYISLDGELHLSAGVASSCYNRSGQRVSGNDYVYFGFPDNFTVSNTKNMLYVVGCDTQALFQDYWGIKLYTGCFSSCTEIEDVTNGSCTGIGCCESSFTQEDMGYQITLLTNNNYSGVWNFNPCGYAFLAKNGAFNFSSLDLQNLRNKQDFPVVINWVIGNETCNEAKKNPTRYACRENSICVDSENGYLCTCKNGYQGNPYLSGSDGCQDVDECITLRPCNKICHNLEGSYNCSCPPPFIGDGYRNGTGCTLELHNQSERFPLFKTTLGIAISIIALLVVVSWLYLVIQKRKLRKLKERIFRQNGGFILQQRLSTQEGSSEAAKIFTVEELQKATRNYDESLIIGKGGYGTVYKGYLDDNRVVAIKKSKIVGQSQMEQFINEVVVLSQINHRHVVKLLGCCLETEVPLLVYEFVINGTLFDYIHNQSRDSIISWEARLRIAAEVAGALSYLHSAASIPIIHRDVKTANILLDDCYAAKVSDFGASRLVPLDQTELATMVQGTLGYLDPEYMLTSQLTEKSDVYSFGVVLVELLTGMKALSFDRSEEERSLAMYFLSSMKEDRLFEVLEISVINEKNKEMLREAALLATGCLRLKGEDRPSMKEVAMELEGIRMRKKHPWVGADLNLEETEYLLHETPKMYECGDSSSRNTGYDSMIDQDLMSLNDGR